MAKRIFRIMLAFCSVIIFVTCALVVAFLHTHIELFDSKDIIGIIAVVAAAFVFSMIFSVFFSKRITKSIVAPIEELGNNLDNLENFETYSELQPFADELENQKSKQRELSRQKKQFTANLSHELKTPLTSIAGYAELIESGIAKDEDIKPFASTIRKQALRLVSVSEDIIKLSQLEENDSSNSVSFISVDIYEIAKNCVEVLSVNASLKGITIDIEGESTYIKANPSLIEELMYNLCENAIRYNKPDGNVLVKTQALENEVVLTVRDTGIGISEEYQDKIFERFFRVDKSRSKETGGTGLGLAIVKHIVKLHNARLEINSKLGEGTVISVFFRK